MVVRYACTQMTGCSVFPVYERCEARVRNISISGVGMVMSRAFNPDTLLIVELERRDRTARIAMPARVTHSLQIGPDCWNIGCEFDQPLTNDALKALV